MDVVRRTADHDPASDRGQDWAEMVIEASSVYVIALDEEGRVSMINPAMLAATEYSREEVEGRLFDELFLPPDRRPDAASREQIRSPRSGPVEQEIITKTGGRLLVEWRCRSIVRRAGEPELLLAVGRDISLYRKALDALQESHEVFLTILDNFQAGMFIADRRLRLAYVNLKLAGLLGGEPDQFVGLEAGEMLSRLVGADTAAAMVRLIARCRSRRRSLSGRLFAGRASTARFRWFEMHCTAIGGAGDGRVAVHLLDLTKQRRAQRKLIEREQRFRTLVQAAPVGILAVDRRGRILEMNRTVLEIFGSTTEEIAQRLQSMACGSPTPSAFSADFSRCLDRGTPTAGEASLRGGSGKELVIRYHLTPLAADERKASLIQVILEDITESKRLEMQLLHARKMESLMKLTGGIAHEFNNLLQVIQGYAELLAIGSGSKEETALEVREIHAAAVRAAELTSHLLTFSGSGKTLLRPLDLNREVSESMELLRRSMLKFADVGLHLEEPLPAIMGDARQMRQLLTNLALNAKEALPLRGLVSVRTSAVTVGGSRCDSRKVLPPGRYVKLEFRDNGSGIRSQDEESIFDPFFTTKRPGEKQGLGLSVVYGIVRAHRGFLQWRSSAEEGTVFDLFFPAAPCGEETRKDDAVPCEPQEAAEGTTILFADGEPALGSLARTFLAGLGYRVLSAASGEEALGRFNESAAVDLLVIDPAMSAGERCLQEILRAKPSQRILIAGSPSLSPATEELLERAALEFIEKPYDLLEFSSLVRGLLAAGNER